MKRKFGESKIERIARLERENETLRRELTNTRTMIGAIVKQNGGSITVHDSTICDVNPGDAIIYDKSFEGFSRIRYEAKGRKIENGNIEKI